jgi:glycosyltransferase involved in cell wall biosynthesis
VTRRIGDTPVGLPSTLYVVALDPGQKFGSLEEQTLGLGRAFRDEGATFIPLFECAPTGELANEFAQEGLLAEGLDLWRFRPATLRRLVDLVDRHRVQVVHWNFYDPLSPYLFGLSMRRPRLRHLFTNHSSRTWPFIDRRSVLRRWAKGRLLSRYDQVLGVSDFVARCMVEEGWWGKVGRFWHFVNLNRFRPDPADAQQIRRELGAEDAFVIVVVAQLIPEKGIQVLLEAMPALPECTQLWIIGQGPHRHGLESVTAGLGVASRVRFLGSQSRVERFMRGADVAVCPSLWAEAAGLVNLEAQAVGLPVVASAVGGIPEFVRHEQTGLLFPPGDRSALQQCVHALWSNPALRESLSRGALAHARGEFGVEAVLQRNLEVYRGLVQATRGLSHSTERLPGHRRNARPGSGG